MNRNNFGKIVLYACCAVLPFLFDRITKWLVLNFIHGTIKIMPGVSFVLVKNRGLSWSILHAENRLQTYILITLILAVIGILIHYTYISWQRGQSIAGHLMVFSGALSNLLDRFLYDGVIDFIELSANGFVWPDFNIADIAIVMGVAIMIYQNWRSS